MDISRFLFESKFLAENIESEGAVSETKKGVTQGRGEIIKEGEIEASDNQLASFALCKSYHLILSHCTSNVCVDSVC